MAKKMAQITRMGVLYLSFLFILIFWTTDNGLQTTDKVATEREQRLLAGSAERSNFNFVNLVFTIYSLFSNLVGELCTAEFSDNNKRKLDESSFLLSYNTTFPHSSSILTKIKRNKGYAVLFLPIFAMLNTHYSLLTSKI